MVLAWLLHSGHVSSLSDGLDLVTRLRPQSQPNPGFVKQLELYQRLNCSLVRDSLPSPLYVNFALQHNSLLVESLTGGADQPVSSKKIRCSKCRKILTYRHHVIDHTPGVFPHWSLDVVRTGLCGGGVFVVDTSLLPEDLRLQEENWRQANRLQCRHCSSKIGNWGLASCGCGAKGGRGIWLNLTKVDS